MISIALMFADNRFGYVDTIRYGVGFLTAPIYWLSDAPSAITNAFDESFIARSELVEQNKQLKQRLLVAQNELRLLENVAFENSRLLELDQSASSIFGEVSPAEIINISPDLSSKRVLINKGALNDVVRGQAVLDANGLMGQVDQVMPTTSWVLLITDSHHQTPVEVNRNGERALARGTSRVPGRLELEFVTASQDIMVGDKLVSSGMGSVYPKNYPVGEVETINRNSGQDFLTVTVRPFAKLDSTRLVLLVKANPVDRIDLIKTESAGASFERDF
jgi:rod shape-determining protein MreC